MGGCVLPACALWLLVSAGACQSTAGNHLVTFHAAGAGPLDAVRPLTFANDAGYAITLTTAVLHIGAVYLNQTRPLSGAQATSCILPGIYVGQVVRGLDVDLLSAEPQPFPVLGEGTDLSALAGEVWLTHGDVNQEQDTLPMLHLEGLAVGTGGDGSSGDGAGGTDTATYPFAGTLTIGANRRVAAPSAAQPGANPICKQRIVTPIPVDFALSDGGTLTVRADPRALLANVDFAALTATSDTPPEFVFDDQSQTHPSRLLYLALRAAGTYGFEWQARE